MSVEELLLPYRLRTVRSGVYATFLVLAGLVVVPFLPTGQRFDTVPYLGIIGVAATGGVVVALLPWRRSFEQGIGVRLMYTWSVLDILLITALIPFSGGPASHIFWVYTLTTFFMAASYPPRGQVVLLGLTYASYTVVLAVTRLPIAAGDVVLRFSILGVLTFMASFLSRELMRQIASHGEARQESERRAALLSTVAGATRRVSSLDSDRVLSSVVDAAASLGFQTVVLCVLEPDGLTYRVVHPRGVPEDYSRGPYRASEGIQAIVRERGETLVVDDYSDHPKAIPTLARAGLHSCIATPVWVGGRIAAVLAAGTRHRRPSGAEVVEALELLAAHAGRALENAQRFEAERETVRRMAELDRLKQDFLSNVSHELRTPLTAIEGMGVTLEERWTDLDEARRLDLLSRLNANARALDDVITNLLDFSSLDAGQIRLQRETIDLSVLVRDVAARLRSLFDEGTIRIGIDRELLVCADRRLLDRVLENLLSNAAKHTPAGTLVELTARRTGSSAVVTIRDEGPGIPEAELDHVGERFFRGGDVNTRPTKGTGLGLAFVREILSMHDSALEISSAVGQGSSFSFQLPLVAEAIRDDLSRRRVASWT